MGKMLKKFFLLAVIFSIALISVESIVLADDVQKVVFCSINQTGHKLYKISDAVLSRAFNNLNIEFEMKEMPPNRIVRELNMGTIDGDSHRIYDFNAGNKYPNLIRVEESIQTIEQVVFTKLKDVTIEGWKSLLPYKILYIKGIKAIEKNLEAANFPPGHRLGVYNIDMAFDLLNKDRGDMVIVSPSTGKHSLEKLELTHAGIRRLSPPIITIQLYPYMNKKHARLAKKVAQELRLMKQNGEYEKILNALP